MAALKQKSFDNLLHPRSTTHCHGQRYNSIELLCYKISFIVYKCLSLQARHLAVIIGQFVAKMENISLKPFQVYTSKKLETACFYGSVHYLSLSSGSSLLVRKTSTITPLCCKCIAFQKSCIAGLGVLCSFGNVCIN